MYELELLYEFIEVGKFVLGICCGCQLINVVFGGMFYQDIVIDVLIVILYVNEQYDSNYYVLYFLQGLLLVGMVKIENVIVNFIYYQVVYNFGCDLLVEVVLGLDQIVEVICYCKVLFVMGLQWYLEFYCVGGLELLDCMLILDSFLWVVCEICF